MINLGKMTETFIHVPEDNSRLVHGNYRAEVLILCCLTHWENNQTVSDYEWEWRRHGVGYRQLTCPATMSSISVHTHTHTHTSWWPLSMLASYLCADMTNFDDDCLVVIKLSHYRLSFIQRQCSDVDRVADTLQSTMNSSTFMTGMRRNSGMAQQSSNCNDWKQPNCNMVQRIWWLKTWKPDKVKVGPYRGWQIHRPRSGRTCMWFWNRWWLALDVMSYNNTKHCQVIARPNLKVA